MVLTLKDALGILIAALGGAAVGLEREWSGHGAGPSARFAGIRTCSLLGLLAGSVGWLWSAYVLVARGNRPDASRIPTQARAPAKGGRGP